MALNNGRWEKMSNDEKPNDKMANDAKSWGPCRNAGRQSCAITRLNYLVAETTSVSKYREVYSSLDNLGFRSQFLKGQT